MILSELLKSKRETKNLLLREVASMIDTDTALISKIENGDRKPTREQIDKLAIALDVEHSKLLKLWLSEKVYDDVKGEDLAIEEEKLTGKYIRPIVLFQAQSNIKGKNNTTFQKTKEQLIKIKIPEEQIKIKTSGIDELKGIDLMAKDCPVKYIGFV